MESFIRWYDGALSDEFCEDIIHRFDKSHHKEEGRVGQKELNVSDKKSIEIWIEKKNVKHQWADVVAILRKTSGELVNKYISENKFWGLADRQFQLESFRIKKYRIGDYHTWHFDTSSPRIFTRLLAIQFYFNTVEEGGETEFSPFHDCLKVKPVQGRVVVFPTLWTHVHRGAPPKSGPKYSGNGYIKVDPQWVLEYVGEKKRSE